VSTLNWRAIGPGERSRPRTPSGIGNRVRLDPSAFTRQVSHRPNNGSVHVPMTIYRPSLTQTGSPRRSKIRRGGAWPVMSWIQIPTKTSQWIGVERLGPAGRAAEADNLEWPPPDGSEQFIFGDFSMLHDGCLVRLDFAHAPP
jgi:hypothetical protein